MIQQLLSKGNDTKKRAFQIPEELQSFSGLSINTLALVGAVLFAFPFYYILVASSFSEGVIYQFPPKLTPGGQYLQNFSNLLFETQFSRTLLNSLIYATFSTIGVLIVATTSGYAFAKFEFPGRKPLFYVTLITLAIPFQLIAIPLFSLLVDFGLANTFVGLVLPAVAHPIGVFFMRQNIEQTIIDDMLNSARIDGASEIQVFRHIVFPLIRPGLAALAVLMFMLRMNELFWPLVVMRSDANSTATMFLATFLGGPESPPDWTVMMPAALLASIPVLIVFIFLQKHFVKGLLAGSVKQ
ncbi:carbohydrate ABC transporter permease [Haloferax sp. YSSS75]|uniref:carbohydrate ABC transporter permease n=1 Tax=Haloferax sp. YSSS75 TaxID=3388564 RepID=UPI00398CA92F